MYMREEREERGNSEREGGREDEIDSEGRKKWKTERGREREILLKF